MMSSDIERITFSEEEIRTRVQELGAQIARDYADASETVYCVGILKGAAVFFTDLVRAIDRPVAFDFMIVSSYGDAAVSSGQVKILKDLDFSIEGQHVIIVEDIIDSGTTMHYLKHMLMGRHPKSIKICAFLTSRPLLLSSLSAAHSSATISAHEKDWKGWSINCWINPSSRKNSRKSAPHSS